ncbi:hypothetical protein [Cloacibacterium caeni]|uniref:hypothetical protein n=1 Tax=Cloacibacterium caeni TaxID=2004710 RepID=UPI001BCF41DB|nr:hypothetical protein [Cloacibacterium caeni]
MKKLLMLSTIVFCGILFAQNLKFDKVYSTQELLSKQSTISENEKRDFYKQYFKANLFENIKEKFTYKKYPENLLKKFTDSIVKAHDFGDEFDVPFEKEKILTFEEFEKQKIEYVTKQKESLEKMKNDDPKAYDLLINMKDFFKNERTGDIKKDYETYVKGVNESNNYSPENERKNIVKELDSLFVLKQYNTEFTNQLLEKNLNSLLGSSQYFPIPVSKYENDGEIYEMVPNDILAFEMGNGYAAGRYSVLYKIDGENLVSISEFPENDKNFVKKLSKYIKSSWRFESRSVPEIKKLKTGEYFIVTSLYREEDAACCPSMAIEYKTQDFKKFIPLKILTDPESNKWINIK